MFTASLDSGNVMPWTSAPAASTSVTYTSPASASPDVTFASTSVTDCSSLTGWMSTPVASSTLTVAAPQGTSGAQTTTLMPSFARSANEATPAGLSGGTAISRVLVAKSSGSAAWRSSAVSLSMLAVSAEAKTSAGAPSWIWATRSEEPPKLNSTVTPSCWASNSVPICSNVLVSDEAAYTVRVVPPPASPPESSSPHAARPAISRAEVATSARRRPEVMRGIEPHRLGNT